MNTWVRRKALFFSSHPSLPFSWTQNKTSLEFIWALFVSVHLDRLLTGHVIRHTIVKVSSVANKCFNYYYYFKWNKKKKPATVTPAPLSVLVFGPGRFLFMCTLEFCLAPEQVYHQSGLWIRHKYGLHARGCACVFREPRLTGGFVFGSGRSIPLCLRPRCRAWLWPDRQPSTWSWNAERPCTETLSTSNRR